MIGNQKSGTTAIAALLAAYIDASVTLDLFPYLTPRLLQETLGTPDGLSHLLRRFKLEFSRDVVKEPHLTFFYPELVERFPNARFVMVVRDPRDNIRSILDRLGIPGDLAGAAPDAFDVPGTWPLVLDGSWLGFDGDDYIEHLAWRWNRTASIAIDDRDRFEVVRYEDFMRDKEAQIAKAAKALGRVQRRDIHDILDVPYQQVGNRSAPWEDFFGPDNLHRIQTLCADPMRMLDYDPA